LDYKIKLATIFHFLKTMFIQKRVLNLNFDWP
jgi:hypothetical protein